MIYLFHTLIGLVLILFQTAVRPQIGFLSGFYDVLTAYVIFLGLFRPMKEALPVVLVFGFAMDSISGGPFGLFLTVYLWLLLIIRQTTRFIHPDNLVLRFFAVAIGVVMQNGLNIGVAMILDDLTLSLAPIRQAAVTQVLWALGTGFILVTLFRHFHRIWDNFLSAYFVREAA